MQFCLAKCDYSKINLKFYFKLLKCPLRNTKESKDESLKLDLNLVMKSPTEEKRKKNFSLHTGTRNTI